MKHRQLLNHVLPLRNWGRYLEIGFIDQDDNFNHIDSKYKIRVGNQPGETFRENADPYFLTNKEKFNLIFIDGFHTEEQVLKDIENALGCLCNDGIIVLHDCMPPDEWHQREPEHFQWKRMFDRNGLESGITDI